MPQIDEPPMTYAQFLEVHPDLTDERKAAMAVAIIERRAKTLEAAFRMTAGTKRRTAL